MIDDKTDNSIIYSNLPNQQSNTYTKYCTHMCTGYMVLLKNIPFQYDLRQYQPYTRQWYLTLHNTKIRALQLSIGMQWMAMCYWEFYFDHQKLIRLWNDWLYKICTFLPFSTFQPIFSPVYLRNKHERQAVPEATTSEEKSMHEN